MKLSLQDKDSVSQKLIYTGFRDNTVTITQYNEFAVPTLPNPIDKKGSEENGVWDVLGGSVCYSDFAQYSDFT